MLGFRRHVIFVVFRQNLVGAEHPVYAEAPLGNNAFAFAEEVGQRAPVLHGHTFDGVRDRELHRHAIGFALYAAVFNKTADAKAASGRRFVGCYLGRREKKHQILLESTQDQYAGCSNGGDTGCNKNQAFMPWFH